MLLLEGQTYLFCQQQKRKRSNNNSNNPLVFFRLESVESLTTDMTPICHSISMTPNGPLCGQSGLYKEKVCVACFPSSSQEFFASSEMNRFFLQSTKPM